ncbi:MAG TPA: hypothetical protein VJL54_04170 [Nitrososphaera sp.]|nr:hypothetical protein [Nitrososphaera sp.]
MPIEWEVLIAEMALLAGIIYGAIFVENFLEKRKLRRKEAEEARRIVNFVANDLETKLHFIEDTIKYRDFKPFFTDMWDAVIMGGRQSLLPFELFENLQHTYSWMKYYNTELEQREKSEEDTVSEILAEVKASVEVSLRMLRENKM